MPFFGLVAIAVFIVLQFATTAIAVQPDEMLADPKLEARARTLSRELRCMVCQNQSIDDSEAPLARDLRILVRERLKAGDGDAQVLDFLTARYGEFVLLKPPLTWHTALLWLAPSGVLMLGTVTLIMARRRRMAGSTGVSGAAEPALTASEEERLARLLGSQAGGPARNADR
jgi:cytochrome c-type biogenesis protein CcmH